MQNTLKVDDEDLLTAEKFMGPTKPVLSNWLAEARDVMVRQRTLMDNMKEMSELMKIEALSDKEKLISIQDRLLQCQEELKPLLGRLPGATHIAQIPEALDLIYIYFEDEDSKAKAIALLEDVPMNGVIDT